MADKIPDISIIIVNYNGAGFIEKCISSIIAFCSGDKTGSSGASIFDYEIIIADNASKDNSIEKIKKDFKSFLANKIRIIQAQENLGFAKACNKGAAEAKGQYLLFLNPDTELMEYGLKKVIDFCKSRSLDERVGAVGVKMLNEDGSLQYSCRSFPTLARQFYESFFLSRIFAKSKIFGAYFMTFFDHESIRKVDWLSGSFLLIEKEIFFGAGRFDEDYFIYSEDTDICFKLAGSGHNNYYYPGYRIKHSDAGIASSNMALRHFQVWQSRRLYFKKNYSKTHAIFFSFIYFNHVFIRMMVFSLMGLFFQKDKNLKQIALNYRKTLVFFLKNRTPS